MKRSRRISFVWGVLIVLLFAGVASLFLLGVSGPRFVCHRALDGALQQWKLETVNSELYPNVDGAGSQSLALVVPYLADDPDVLRDYGYVPGLQPNDPEDLILFYLRKPTRRTWHGDTHWIGEPKRWVVINPRMSMPHLDSGRAGGELCEAISFSEFKDRLRKTLDYLKESERPGWQTVESEHLSFLESIGG